MNKFIFTVLFFSIFFINNARAEKISLSQIEDYLNNMSSLKAGFVQIASNGGTAEGKVYISKPSKIRMEYTSPDSLLIVGNGDYIIYNDQELDQITNIDYKDIPATMILTKKIKFDGQNLKVVDLYQDNGQTSVTVAMPKTPDMKPITLVFDNEPFRLKQWKVIDQQNIEITISLFDLSQNEPLSDALFKFDKNTGKPKSKTQRK